MEGRVPYEADRREYGESGDEHKVAYLNGAVRSKEKGREQASTNLVKRWYNEAEYTALEMYLLTL